MNGTFLGAGAYIFSNVILSKIEKFYYIVKSADAAVIGICESKLRALVLSKRLVLIITKFCVVIETDTEEVLPCYVRNDLSYNILSVFPSDTENLSLPNGRNYLSHPLPPTQSYFL